MSNLIYLHQFRTNQQRVETDYSGRDEDDDYLEDSDLEDELDGFESFDDDGFESFDEEE